MVVASKRGSATIFYIQTEKRKAKPFGVEICFYETTLDGVSFRLVPCSDADYFSSLVLRGLLLSDGGREIFSVTAISVSDGKIKYRTEFLLPKP